MEKIHENVNVFLAFTNFKHESTKHDGGKRRH